MPQDREPRRQRRCPKCHGPISRVEPTCPHCGHTDWAAAREGEFVADGVLGTEAALGAAASATVNAAELRRSGSSWLGRNVGLVLALLPGTLLLLLSPLAQWHGGLPVLLGPLLALPLGALLLRRAFPDEVRLHRALRTGQWRGRCGHCSARVRAPLEVGGTWRCPYCRAVTEVVGAAHYLELLATAKQQERDASRGLADLRWRLAERALDAPLRWWVLPLGLALLVQGFVTTVKTWRSARPPRAAYQAGRCLDCVPHAPAEAGPGGTALFVHRDLAGREGLVLFERPPAPLVGPDAIPCVEELQAHFLQDVDPTRGWYRSFGRARWSTSIAVPPAEVQDFFGALYPGRVQRDVQGLTVQGEQDCWRFRVHPCADEGSLLWLDSDGC